MRCDTPEESGSSPRKSTERCMVNIICRTEYIHFTLMTGTSLRYSALLSTIRTCFCVSTYTPNLGNLPLPATRLVCTQKKFCIRGPKAMQCISYKSAPVLCHTRCSSPAPTWSKLTPLHWLSQRRQAFIQLHSHWSRTRSSAMTLKRAFPLSTTVKA